VVGLERVRNANPALNNVEERLGASIEKAPRATNSGPFYLGLSHSARVVYLGWLWAISKARDFTKSRNQG